MGKCGGEYLPQNSKIRVDAKIAMLGGEILPRIVVFMENWVYPGERVGKCLIFGASLCS